MLRSVQYNIKVPLVIYYTTDERSDDEYETLLQSGRIGAGDLINTIAVKQAYQAGTERTLFPAHLFYQAHHHHQPGAVVLYTPELFSRRLSGAVLASLDRPDNLCSLSI